MMRSCWEYEIDNRPSFGQLLMKLTKLLPGKIGQ